MRALIAAELPLGFCLQGGVDACEAKWTYAKNVSSRYSLYLDTQSRQGTIEECFCSVYLFWKALPNRKG